MTGKLAWWHHRAEQDSLQTVQLDVCGGHVGRGDDNPDGTPMVECSLDCCYGQLDDTLSY